MKTRLYILLWVALTALGTGLWMWQVWPVIDDLAYLHRVVEADYWAVGGGLIEGAADLWQSVRAHYALVNSRLANLLALAVLQLPRGAQAAMCGAAAAALLGALVALGGARRRAAAPAAAALMWLALPWHDGLASVDFEINYVWASALALWVLAAAYRGRPRWALAAVAGAFLAGWMHEGIAVMAGAWLACLWMQARGMARRRVAVLAVALAAGFAVNLAGATTTRAMLAMGQGGGIPAVQWMRAGLVQMWPLWLAAAGAVALRKRPGLWRRLAAPAAAAVVSLAMCAVLRVLGRAAWGVNLAAAVMLLMELQELRGCRRPGARRAWLAAAVAVYALWLGHLVAWQARIGAEEREMARLAAGAAGDVRLAVTPACDIPFTLMGIVQHPPLMTPNYNAVFARHYAGLDGLAVLPPGAAAKVPGDNPFYDSRWGLLRGPAGLPDTLRVEVAYGPPRAAATPLDRLAALAGGRSAGFTTDALAVRGHAPGIYFVEGAGRRGRGRAIVSMSVTAP